MSDITVQKKNESFLSIRCDLGIAMELSEAFMFEVPGAKFQPAFKRGIWDGKIRLFNLGKRTLPVGLFHKLKEFGEQRNYSICLENSEKYGSPDDCYPVSKQDVAKYVESLDLHGSGNKVTVRDYQLDGIWTALNKQRGILNSATGSGKSLMLYSICRYMTEVLKIRVLIIVPTISLTSQLKSDFDDYSSNVDWSADDNVHTITAGVSKNIDKPIVISTFQSIYKMPADWYNGTSGEGMQGFGAIICDEGHKIQSKTIAGIYEIATEVKYKLACTGSVHDTKCHILTMQGLTGKVYDIATTKKLIDDKQLVPLDIKVIVLDYDKEICSAMSKVDYETEIKFITTNTKRNKFISNLSIKCVGTTLVLFRYIDQGKVLFNTITDKVADTRKVYFIDGSVTGEDRETIRSTANFEGNSIIVASMATFSTGVNLPSIENIIFAHPFKSKITGLQSIGRGLRLKTGKTKCVLFDISDNMTHKRYVNTVYSHLGDRLDMYTNAGFDFNITHIPFVGA